MVKKIIFWTLAVLITLGASVYQRMTGPTHPQYVKTSINGQDYKFILSRSGGEKDEPILLEGLKDEKVLASLFYRKYPTNDTFTKVEMKHIDIGLCAQLPVQPAAGKLEYYIQISSRAENGESISSNTSFYFKEEPLIIRFKGEVPAYILIPHILCMFISMLFASYALLCAISNINDYKKYLRFSFYLLFIGGFILGPIVQKFAFDIFWSGFPFGSDLTDNKTLIALIALIAAVLTTKKPWNRWVTIAAILVMFVVFSIPHSMRGSELNHNTGTIETSK